MKRKHTHIGSYGIITSNNKIVLIKKARGGYTGKLDLPGGGIEHTETPEIALKREIMEEVGINITNYRLLTTLAANITWKVAEDYYEDLHHIGIIYLIKSEEKKLKITPDGLDSNGANWYDIDTIDVDSLTPFAKYAITYLKKDK